MRDPAAAAQGGAGARSGEEPARPRGRGETRWVATVKAPSSCRVSFLAASVHLALAPAPAARGDSFGNFYATDLNPLDDLQALGKIKIA